MKKLVFKSFILILIIAITYISLFLTISLAVPPQFRESYQYVLNDKYENLINTRSPKIICIGGSSFAFGLNTKLLKEKTGYNSTNLGLQGGLGMQFQTEIAKSNISKGDIVIIAYEYWGWSSEFDPEILITGIDNNIRLYRYMPKGYYKNAIKYFPTYLFKKLNSALIKPLEFKGTYSRSSFDNFGNLTLDRPEFILQDLTELKFIEINKKILNDDMVEYVNSFNNYIKSKGALLLISFPPVLDELVVSDNSERLEFQKYLEEKLNPPIISNIDDYIMGREYFFDTAYHLNNSGEVKRTEILIRDINKFLNNK